MALDNLLSVSFTDSELTQINASIQQISDVLVGKVINLTPEERQQYGSIADRNKILVNKCKDYMEQASETLPRTIDKEEFDRDYEARKQIELPLRNLLRVVEKLSDTKMLLDHDNLQAALTYYRYVRYLAHESEPGTTVIYEDLKKHYQGGRPPQTPTKTEPSDNAKEKTEE